MTFTEADAENDGLIKREVGRQMAKVAKTHNPEVFNHFSNVCDEIGREPADIFGEMAVRCLNSEQFADRVLSAEINMSQLRADEIRLEDVKYVKKLSDELGLNEKDERRDPIDQLIDKRLQSITRSPVPRLNEGRGTASDSDAELQEYMQKMNQRLEQMEQAVADSSDQPAEEPEAPSSSGGSIDDLFDEGQDSDTPSDDGGVDEGFEDGHTDSDTATETVSVSDDDDSGGFIEEDLSVPEEDTEDSGSYSGDVSISDDVDDDGPFSSMEAEEE